MYPLLIFSPFWLALAIGLFVAWVRAELRCGSVSRRLWLGIGTIVCATALAIWGCWCYEDGRQAFDFRNFGDLVTNVQDAIHNGNAAEVEPLLGEVNPDRLDAETISTLNEKIDKLTETGPEDSAKSK
jgi:hypothetical protein